MDKEQLIILGVLCEVRDKMYAIADSLRAKAKQEQDLAKTMTLAQADTVEATILVVAEVAQKHGIEVKIEQKEDNE